MRVYNFGVVGITS